MRRFAVGSGALALMALHFTASPVRAQGFGVYEHDACTMARAGTGVAKPCNASAIFFNPAAMIDASGPKWHVAFGGTLISPKFTFADSVSGTTTNSIANTVIAPNLFVTRQMEPVGGHAWALGFGVFAPYGLVSEWPNTFGGRFLAYRSDLKSLYFQPTVSFQVNRWVSIGAGFDFVHAWVDLRQRVDLSTQKANATTTFAQLGIPAGTDFADAHLHGKSDAAGGHFGILINPTSKLHLGARYLLRVHSDIQGDATFDQIFTGITLPAGNPLGAPGGTSLDTVLAAQFRTGGALIQQHASVVIPFPDQFVAGIAYDITPEITALFDYQFVHWRKFIQLPLTFAVLGAQTQFEDYNNTHGWRFGGQYQKDNLAIRVGYLFHTGAAPDQTVTPLLPEARRSEITGGIGYTLSNHMQISAAFQHITQQDRRGRIVSAPRGPAGAAFNTGLYTGSATLFGASLSWGF